MIEGKKASVRYFTGTGNSLAIARDCDAVFEASGWLIDIEPIAEAGSGSGSPPLSDAEAAVFVFPVYSLDLPRVARRYLDERYTPGQQIYLLDVETGEAEPLVVDARYNHAAVSWDPSGERILFQRFALQEADARPEIWMLDLTTNEVRRIVENACLPAWAP